MAMIDLAQPYSKIKASGNSRKLKKIIYYTNY